MNQNLGTDSCEDVLECSENFTIFDPKNTSVLLQLEDDLSDETELFNMTSLGTLVFLEQRSFRETTSDLNATPSLGDETNRLTLAYERLSSIPRPLIDRFALTVHSLDISHNEFSNLDFLVEFRHLSSLVADHNLITAATDLPQLPNLELIWLNHCKIGELFPWARRLQHSCPNLRHISLMGNPAAPSYLNGGTFFEYLQYRLFMISLFPKLIHLDDRAVTDAQRSEANRLYERPFLERLAPRALNALPSSLRERATTLFQNDTPFKQRDGKNNIV